MTRSIFSRSWIVLSVACALGTGLYAARAFAGIAPAATDDPSQTLSFDPFTLTTITSSTPLSGSTAPSASPTIRPPTRNPFRPPARSPFIPGPAPAPALDA
jgi:hypothetical protein